MVEQFAEWLSRTPPSLFIQTHYAWVIPTLQSVHIAAIGIVLTSVAAMDLRVLGWAGRDQTLGETRARFGPWLNWALLVLLATGVLMVIGEPVRELMSFSFRVKMVLVVLGTLIAAAFQVSLKKDEPRWERTLAHGGAVRWLAVLTLLIWGTIVILGRLIAYDYVWGGLSPLG